MASSLQRGINAAKAGRTDEALEFLKDAIIEEPQNADVWVWIAAIIEDGEKQEVFLKKALEIDPHNVPAQRGLAFLRKRTAVPGKSAKEQLSDHTSPITPFPKSEQSNRKPKPTPPSLKKISEISNLARDVPKPQKESEEPSGGFFEDLPKLSPVEIILLGVIVLVFCFIGILAASSLFNFELPLPFIKGSSPTLSQDPPYTGAFLVEGNAFLDIQTYESLPAYEIGIPVTYETKPLIVLHRLDVSEDNLILVYESGTYIPFTIHSLGKQTLLFQPEEHLKSGLYCFRETDTRDSQQAARYWCFRINPENQ